MDEHAQMIEDCMNRESRMTEWESSFIDSLYDWIADGKTLTEKQEERLTTIWNRVTARG